MNRPRLSVIGLGKLGLCMASLFAHRGYQVIGVDIDPVVVRAVNDKRCLICEPGLAAILEGLADGLVATHDVRNAVANSKATFIVVPTPSEASGAFSTKYVDIAASAIAEGLRSKEDYHLIVLTSTVLPGATAALRELLERGSGKKCGRDFGLCYSPEFIALGNVIQGLSEPDMVLIGESDSRPGEMLSAIYETVCANHPPIVRTSFENAELAKILLNSYVTMKISFANTVAELCEGVPGGDVDQVTRALGLDSRIGKKYLSGGLGFGGPCFPRDNRAVAHVARSIGVDARLAVATDEVNRHQNDRIVGLIKEKTGALRGRKIAILGITYKPDTDVVEESAALAIAKGLIAEGARVSVYDPAGLDKARAVLGEDAEYAASIQTCLSQAELCVLGTPWSEFRSLRAEDFTGAMRRPLLLDCWRLFSPSELGPEVERFAIGLNSSRVREGAGRK